MVGPSTPLGCRPRPTRDRAWSSGSRHSRLGWGITRQILPPKDSSGGNWNSAHFHPKTLGAGKLSTAAPTERPSPAPRPDSHTQGWESRHPAPDTGGDRPTRAWSHGAGPGLGAAGLGVDGVARPKLSPVGGLGPAAARKTGFRRLF